MPNRWTPTRAPPRLAASCVTSSSLVRVVLVVAVCEGVCDGVVRAGGACGWTALAEHRCAGLDGAVRREGEFGELLRLFERVERAARRARRRAPRATSRGSSRRARRARRRAAGRRRPHRRCRRACRARRPPCRPRRRGAARRGATGPGTTATEPSRRSAASVYWVRSLVPIDAKSASARMRSASSAERGHLDHDAGGLQAELAGEGGEVARSPRRSTTIGAMTQRSAVGLGVGAARAR